jgi:hypothetical protein
MRVMSAAVGMGMLNIVYAGIREWIGGTVDVDRWFLWGRLKVAHATYYILRR